MNKANIFALVLGIGALAACQQSPQEAQADNIEANADAAAESFEAVAENVDNEVIADQIENQAEGLRDTG
ncbi:MAG TPA: hypothetical protein VF637_05110, partial [Sphingomicrobium sp.]